MAECSRGGVIAHPASGFLEPVKFNLTKPFKQLVVVRLVRYGSSAWQCVGAADPVAGPERRKWGEQECLTWD
jgi:hypothetical protein